MRCQICDDDKVFNFLNLGEHPACIFVSPEQFKSEKRFTLDVWYCPACGLVQLGHPVDQNILFGDDYHHIAALSSSFKEHLKALAEDTAKKFKLSSKDLVVELGSNDGALLEAFKPHQVKVLGVDPSDVSQIAIDKGIPTIREFFNEKLAAKMVKEHGKAKIIASLNTFAHVSNLDSFVRGVRDLLTDDGAFITESHYVLDLIKDLQYDFIYHEHSRYYAVRTLVHLFQKHGMEVFDVERIPTHSGSIRVYAGKKGARPVAKVVADLLKAEEQFGLKNKETYLAFAKKVQEHKAVFVQFLKDLRAKGQRIAGLTFPARAVTLLNFCGIGPETLDCITEMSTLKIGRYSPGTHIKVVDQEMLFRDGAPEYGLLLSWHIAKEILPRFKAKGFKGKFILPLPTPTIVE